MGLLDTLIALEEQNKLRSPEKYMGPRSATGALLGPRAIADPTRSNLFVNSALEDFRRESTANRLARTLGALGVEEAKNTASPYEDPAQKAKVAFDVLTRGRFNPLDLTQTPSLAGPIVGAGLDILAGKRKTGGTEYDIQELKNRGLLNLQGAENKGGNQQSLIQALGLFGFENLDEDLKAQLYKIVGLSPKGKTRQEDDQAKKEDESLKTQLQALIDKFKSGR